MPHHVKRIARTTAAKSVTYAGPAGELVMDITNNDLVLQNGQAGGVRLAKASTVIDATNGVNITTGGTLGATTVVSGVDASTSAKGVVQLSNATDGTSQAMAATPKAVSDALQAAKDYADTAGAPYSGTAPIAVDATNRVISVTDATTSAKGAVQLSNAMDGTSQTMAATSKAVSDALQAAKDYADTVGAPYSGTAPINVNSSTRVISVTDATTAAKGVVQLSNATAGTSQTTAATEKAVADALQAAKDYTDSSMGAKRNIGEIVYSMVPLEDAGMHLLDGSVLPSSGVYAEAVNYITGLQSTYPQLFTTEANWQASVSQYDVCGKFVYDAGAGTLRLPKVTGFIEGTVDPTAIGQLVEAGLPNITGSTGNAWARGGYATGVFDGALYQIGAGYQGILTPGTGWASNAWGFDASRSSPIYGNSTTVQPQAIKGFVYMVVANSIKTPVQVDINRIAADLALKADVSLGNVNSAGSAAMAHAAMPSDKYISVALPANGGTVIAPADGYYALSLLSGNSTTVNSGAVIGFKLQNKSLGTAQATACPGAEIVAFMPVQKGDVVLVFYNARGGNMQPFYFTYANGSAPQP